MLCKASLNLWKELFLSVFFPYDGLQMYPSQFFLMLFWSCSTQCFFLLFFWSFFFPLSVSSSGYPRGFSSQFFLVLFFWSFFLSIFSSSCSSADFSSQFFLFFSFWSFFSWEFFPHNLLNVIFFLQLCGQIFKVIFMIHNTNIQYSDRQNMLVWKLLGIGILIWTHHMPVLL